MSLSVFWALCAILFPNFLPLNIFRTLRSDFLSKRFWHLLDSLPLSVFRAFLFLYVFWALNLDCSLSNFAHALLPGSLPLIYFYVWAPLALYILLQAFYLDFFFEHPCSRRVLSFYAFILLLNIVARMPLLGFFCLFGHFNLDLLSEHFCSVIF